MRAALRFAKLPALLSVVAIAIAVVLTGRTELILRLYVLALAAVALIHLVRAVRAAHPPRARSPFVARATALSAPPADADRDAHGVVLVCDARRKVGRPIRAADSRRRAAFRQDPVRR